MLVLNRKLGESLIVGDNIEIKILEIQDGKIKIGIEAPKDISILRKEVYDLIKAENEASINTGDNILDILKNIK
jgi:carbon storage regulator